MLPSKAMITLKEKTDKLLQEFWKKNDKAWEARDTYKQKLEKSTLSAEAQIEKRDVFTVKVFKPVENAEKKYLESVLVYVNSDEYINGEYKKDRARYASGVQRIAATIEGLKKMKDDTRVRIGNKRYSVETQAKWLMLSFLRLKTAYQVKAGSYVFEDIEVLYAERSMKGLENCKPKQI